MMISRPKCSFRVVILPEEIAETQHENTDTSELDDTG
jgi:hypothetical protein